jgi:hypothetical protein
MIPKEGLAAHLIAVSIAELRTARMVQEARKLAASKIYQGFARLVEKSLVN